MEGKKEHSYPRNKEFIWHEKNGMVYMIMGSSVQILHFIASDMNCCKSHSEVITLT
jgi:hypothetical protein